MSPVSDFRAPPFAPRIWVEGDSIVLLFHDGQAIRIPRCEPERLARFIEREQRRYEIRHPSNDWLERWSLSSQTKMAEIRAEADRAALAKEIAAARQRAVQRTVKKKVMERKEAFALLAEVGL